MVLPDVEPPGVVKKPYEKPLGLLVGVRPDVLVYTAVMRAYGRNDDWQAAFRVWEQPGGPLGRAQACGGKGGGVFVWEGILHRLGGGF